ncbi:MAG: hypothetical protein JNJ55_12220 [Betaproteobacteria bacterium]|nr:hypothetical protein [Betaproteobacteria bacterium]
MKRILRSIFGVVAGLILVSMLVEGLEFGLVTAIHGKPTKDPVVYFAIRNQGWFLGFKLVYNTAAAVVGGFVAAWIAGYAPVKHGVALAIVQTLAFGWALTQPDVRQTTPDWAWLALIVVSFAGIVWGARLRARRRVAG